MAFEPNSWVRATARAVAGEHFHIEGDDGPEVDPLMALEALGQSSALLMLLSHGLDQSGMLVSVGRIEVMGVIRPGQVLELRADVVPGREAWITAGTVSVHGRPVLAATDLMAVFVHAGDLEERASLERRMAHIAPRR